MNLDNIPYAMWPGGGFVDDIEQACEYGEALANFVPGSKLLLTEYCRSILLTVISIEQLERAFTREHFMEWVQQYPKVEQCILKKLQDLLT